MSRGNMAMFVGVGVSLVACSADVAPGMTDGGTETGTQLVVNVVTDGSNFANFVDELTVDVAGPNGTVRGMDSGPGDVDFPVTVGVLPPVGEPGAVVRIEVEAITGRGNVVRASRTTYFIAGESRLVTIELEGDCLRVDCSGSDETCSAGSCISDFVAAEELPQWPLPTGG